MLLDWLPWNHTFGANHNFNLVLRHAGTLFIDGGRPVPGADRRRPCSNLGEISPTIYFNVPAGYARAAAVSRTATRRWRASFFAKLRLIFYAGAALPQDLWDAARSGVAAHHRRARADDVVLGHDRNLAARRPPRIS